MVINDRKIKERYTVKFDDVLKNYGKKVRNKNIR